jgi:hypothetical protein
MLSAAFYSGDLTGLDRPVSIVLLTAPSLRSDNPASDNPPSFDALSKALRWRGPKGVIMVDIRGWLLSLVIGLGFWGFVSACLSLLIQ